MFRVICSILTLALIYQVLFTFAVTRPTTTSKEEKELQVADFPEVVVCLNPGLNYESLSRYGYSGTYSLGITEQEWKFVGWNGGEHENRSSLDILEEALLVPDSWTRLIDAARYFIKSESEYFDSKMETEDWDSECKIPCTRSKYTTRSLAKSKWPYTVLQLIFDRKVGVTHSTFSIDGQTLATKLGGAVSSGRTLQ